MKKTNGIIWGLLLIAVGIIWALSSFNMIHIDLFFDGWWTLFIIIPSLISLFTSTNKSGSIIGLFIGGLFLAAEQHVFDYDMLGKLILPAVLIVIGISIITRNFQRKQNSQYRTEPIFNEHEAGENCTAFFCGQNLDYSNKHFSVAKLAAIFGGIKCNLDGAVFENENHIDLFCMFGGCDITIPKNVMVEISSFCLLGGVSDKRQNTKIDADSPKIYINGFCMFGGAEIQ